MELMEFAQTLSILNAHVSYDAEFASLAEALLDAHSLTLPLDFLKRTQTESWFAYRERVAQFAHSLLSGEKIVGVATAILESVHDRGKLNHGFCLDLQVNDDLIESFSLWAAPGKPHSYVVDYTNAETKYVTKDEFYDLIDKYLD